jgi:hypothetical protein
MPSQLINLTQEVWTQITTSSADGSIRHHEGKTKVVYVVAASIDSELDTTTSVMRDTIIGAEIPYSGIPSGSFVWAYAISSNAKVVVTSSNGASLNLDAGYFNGERAVNTQNYTETNVKLGLQFSIAIEIPILSGTTKYLSLRTPAGINSVIIKTRLISTNGGMRYTPRVGAVFVETGSPIPIVNLNGQSANISDVIALVLNTVPTNIGTAIDVIRSAAGQGNQNEQGIFTGDGLERVLAKDAPYLLSFENLENSDIYVIFNVTWFEGVPDLSPIG